MHFLYKRAAIEELELLVKTRIEVLRAANRLDSSVGLQEVEEHTRRYYKESLQNGQQCIRDRVSILHFWSGIQIPLWGQAESAFIK